MADHPGDPALQPPECESIFTPYSPEFPRPRNALPSAQGEWSRCLNIRSTYDGYDSESYGCDVCGKRYTLYYEDMQ